MNSTNVNLGRGEAHTTEIWKNSRKSLQYNLINKPKWPWSLAAPQSVILALQKWRALQTKPWTMGLPATARRQFL